MTKLTVAMFDPGEKFMGDLYSNDQTDKTLSLLEKAEVIGQKFLTAYQQAKTAMPLDENHILLFVCPENTLLNFNDASGCNAYTKTEVKQLQAYFAKLAKDHPYAVLCVGTANVLKDFKFADTVKKTKYLPYFKSKMGICAGMKYPDLIKHTLQTKTCFKNKALCFFDDKQIDFSKQIALNENVDMNRSYFYPGHGTRFFESNKLKFGMEICIEHDEQKLRDEQIANSNEVIDVHLIVSNYVRVVPENIANQGKNILVVNCAGKLNDKNIEQCTGVWVGDEKGKLTKITTFDQANEDLRIYPPIDVPNQALTLATPRLST